MTAGRSHRAPDQFRKRDIRPLLLNFLAAHDCSVDHTERSHPRHQHSSDCPLRPDAAAS